MSTHAHVIVVGAGVVGASIAWHLVHQGANVTIVASDVGGTATRDSFSWLNATWHNTRAYYDFRRRSMGAWKRIAQELPDLHGVLRWCGSLQWDMSAEELSRFQIGHAAWGYDIHQVNRDEMHQIEPYLRYDILPEWGLRIGEEGAVEAATAASLMVADAQARGARLLSKTVRNLLQESKGVQGVILETGEKLWSDHVVLAAGLGSVPLCGTVGVELPVKGSAALLVHSKPVEKRLLHGLVLSPGLHMRQTADGRLLAGAGFAGSDPGNSPEETARNLFSKVKDIFSSEIDQYVVQQEFFSIGTRPMPLDGLPILGASGVTGLTLAVMHSGVTLAAIVGEVLAEEIVHGKSDSALPSFNLQRFDANPKLD